MLAEAVAHYSGTDESPRDTRHRPRARRPRAGPPGGLLLAASRRARPRPRRRGAPPPPPAKYAAPPPPLRPQQQQHQMYEEPPPTFGSTMKTYFTLGIGVSLGVTAFSVLLRMVGFLRRVCSGDW